MTLFNFRRLHNGEWDFDAPEVVDVRQLVDGVWVSVYDSEPEVTITSVDPDTLTTEGGSITIYGAGFSSLPDGFGVRMLGPVNDWLEDVHLFGVDGSLDINATVPATMLPGTYSVAILDGENTLAELQDALTITATSLETAHYTFDTYPDGTAITGQNYVSDGALVLEPAESSNIEHSFLPRAFGAGSVSIEIDLTDVTAMGEFNQGFARLGMTNADEVHLDRFICDLMSEDAVRIYLYTATTQNDTVTSPVPLTHFYLRITHQVDLHLLFEVSADNSVYETLMLSDEPFDLEVPRSFYFYADTITGPAKFLELTGSES